MKTCSLCKIPLKFKSHYMELFAVDSGIVRNFCARCVKRMYSNLILKSFKKRDEIDLMVYCYNFLKKHKEKIES